MTARASLQLAVAGTAVAAIGAIGVASGDEPHLSLEDLDPWLVVYALGLMVALGAGPYGLYDRFARRIEDKDARWDMALSVWGGIALAAGLCFVALGLVGGFDPAALSGALAIVGAGVCGIVVGCLAVAIVAGG
jgi:hypothetical protein